MLDIFLEGGFTSFDHRRRGISLGISRTSFSAISLFSYDLSI